MASNLKPLAVSLASAIILGAAAPAAAAIVLTQVPAGMRKQNADITVGWTGGQGRVHLRASTVPGGSGAAIAHYDSLHLPSQLDAANYTFKVNPDIPAAYRNTDLRLGVNYCIATDGKTASPEFIIIIESANAPSLNSPANAASIKDLTPTFSWSGDAPFYAILLSDEPFKITEEGTVSGVSAIWQIITPFTTARYGDPDPSGYNTVPAPPLISGKTYNWLVLNNYGNNSASTSKVAPVPSSFTYLPAPPLPAAELIEPADKDTIPGSDQIRFRWSLVDGAVSYKLELLEENLVDGSQADIAIWKATSTGGQITLDNATGLLRRFNYKWRVYAVGNNGAASLTGKRSFFYAVDVGDISVFVKNQAGQKVAYAPVKLNRLGGSSSAVFQGGSTDEAGSLSVKNAPLGTYESRIENLDGYQSKIDTIVLGSKTGATKDIVLSPSLGKILGKVAAAGTGTGILNAKVTVIGGDGTQWTAVSNSQGNYSIGVPYGNWQVKAQADGYAASATLSASLSSSNASRTADFSLAANKFTLSGTVQNSFTRQGIFGATVFLTQAGETRSANTDGNGSFSFSVPSATVTLRVSGAGFASPEPSTFAIDGDKTLNLSLDPNASILSGRTRDVSGTGLPGATVQATPKAGPVRSVISDNQGFFELSLPAGDWIVGGSAKGYASQSSHKFLLDVSKTVQGVDLSFAPNRSVILGRVTVNGAGLAGARIAAGDASAVSDNAGFYQLSVNTGTLQVAASKEGYLIPRTYSVPVNPGDTIPSIDFAASGNAGVVRGRVLSGGAGVVGAVARAVNKSNREAFEQATDGDGAFALSLPGADYDLTASKEGFALDASLAFTLQPGGTILDQNLRMVPDQGAVSGTVASGNATLGGCEVAYRDATNASRSGKTVTDPQGRYSLSLQAGASYAVTATCPAYQAATQSTGALARGGNLALDFNVARAGATYKGRIVDARGTAVAGAKVTAEKSGEAVSALSDFAGAYAFNLGAGTYAISIAKSGYRSVGRQAQLALGENAAAADTLIASVGRVAGRAVSDGNPVAGALITLTGISADAGGGLFTTDADGRYAGDGLPAGTYALTATAEGFADAKLASLTVTAGQQTTADLALAANRGTLEGLVKADGAALANAGVVANAYGISRSALTGPDGRFRIDRLPSGSYTVSASQAGFTADKAYEGQNLSSSGAITGLDFSLSRNAGSLSGTVSGAASAAGIKVSVLGAKKGARAYATCDGAGKYSLPSLPVDDYALSVTAPGYKIAAGSQTPTVPVTGAATYDIALAAAVFRLAGKAVNQANAAIGGLPVELRAGAEKYKATTLADGSYAFANVPAGQEYQLSLKPPTADFDAKDTVFALGLDAPANVEANLRTLSRQASIAGAVALDDAAAEGVLIRVTGNGNSLGFLSQPNGAFKVSGIAGASAALNVSVSKAGARALDTSLIVKVGEAVAGLSFKLKTLKLTLSATLTGSEAKPITGGKVAVAYGTRLDTLAAAADGKISVTGIPANQAVTLATLLDKDAYDNLEASVFLKEKDSALALTATVHATVLTIQAKDQAGASVDGADVIMNGKSLGRTSGGKVTASKLPRGTYRFAAGKSGYKSGPEQSLSVSGDTAATLALTLTKVEGGVYGTVSDTGLDKAAVGSAGAGVASRTLPGAVVLVTAGTDTLRDTVNSLGQYSVDGMADGRKYALTVSLPGYAPVADSLTATNQAQARDLRLRPFPGALVGRVEGGKAGVRMVLSQAASGRLESFATRTGGYYAFSGLQNRSDYSIQAFDGALSSQAAGFQADGAVAKRFDPALEAWGGVRGRIGGGAAAPGAALAGALVSARNVLTGARTWTVSDSAGRYAIAGLAAGSHELAVERAGYRAPKAAALAVAKGTIAEGVDFLLEETEAGIAGTVSDAAGSGLPAVATLAGPKDTLRVQADGGGRFTFGGLAAGTYSLSAAMTGYAASTPIALAYSGKGLLGSNLVLARQANLLSGTVRDALTNTALGGAIVKIAGGATATADSLGRYQAAVPVGAVSILVDASSEGYLARSSIPVYLDASGSATQDIVLTADYKFDGRINVTVKEGKDAVEGLFVTLQSSHPDDSLKFSLTGAAPSSFRDLRRPVPYTIKVKREGFKDLIRVVELSSKAPVLDVALAYPTSQIRVFVTSDGRKGKGVELTLNGQKLPERGDTAGLYASGAKLKPDRYEVAIRDLEADLIPLAPYFISLGEDSVRTDTLAQPFFAVPIADSILDASFRVAVRRVDSLRPAPGVTCSLYYRPKGEPLWKGLALDSAAGGFAGTLPAQSRAGAYEYYHALRSPSGARVGIVTAGGTSTAAFPLAYTGIQSPRTFTLRDPFLLQSFALAPQRLEADTSLYSLGARDIFQVQARGENGRTLDAHFDQRAAAGADGFSAAWAFAEPARASAAGLALETIPGNPRMILFRGGTRPSDTAFQIEATLKMGAVTLKKSFFVKIQDLTPVSVGIRFVKENRVLEEDGAALQVSNRNPAGYPFAAFARTAEGREFNILPRWSLGADTAAGALSQQGVFIPDSSVARSAALRIYDTLQIGTTNAGVPLYGAFTSVANLATFAQVVPSSSGRAVVTNGEGAFLDFNLAGLSKAFTVSVKKPKVSGLLRSSPQQEVVGEILDIELSESQPFKADSGATLQLPVSEGIARRRTVYLGHWNSARLVWEKVDSATADADVSGKVYHFSKYAVLMGSLPLGAYDFIVTPNPFTSRDPWGLQLGYKVSSDVSSQVGVRVEVYNMMGDKVYESQETQLGKGDAVTPGTRKAAAASPDRRSALGPFVWDGHDTKGVACRNGRYLLKLIVKDGKGAKTYLKKVVMLK